MPKKRRSIYGSNCGVHPTHPDAIAVEFSILSAGGSGMGSRSNMDFSEGDQGYELYGRKGNPSCVDIQESRIVTLDSDGMTIVWPAHNLQNDQPIWVGDDPYHQTIFYVHAFTKTPDTFKLSVYPYTPPGVTTPYQPFNFGGGAQLKLNVYARAVLGGNPGGKIGDQPFAGAPIGIYFGNQPYPCSWYVFGGFGEHQEAAGGRGGGGGGPYGGGGACPQMGASDGNAGIDLQGGGGSGAGWMLPDGNYPWNKFGPGGGAGGTSAVGSLEVKPTYVYFAGTFVLGGEPGPGGFRGGRSGMGHVMFIETLRDPSMVSMFIPRRRKPAPVKALSGFAVSDMVDAIPEKVAA